MPHDATVAVPTAISDRDAHLDRAADAEVVVTAIDAEARHEIEMFVSGEQDSEGLDGWWFVTNPPLTGPCMDIWVTLTSMSFFGVTEREARERLSAIYYGPDTAIWHTNNDFDEQEER